MAESPVLRNWVVKSGPTAELNASGHLVPHLPWHDELLEEYTTQDQRQFYRPCHQRIRTTKNARETFKTFLLERKNPDDAWDDLIFARLLPQTIPTAVVSYTKTETDLFWKEASTTIREVTRAAQPGGRLIYAFLAGNLAVLMQAAKVAPTDDRTRQMAFNLLVKFLHFWQQGHLQEMVGPPGHAFMESALLRTVAIWLTASGHPFTQSARTVTDKKTNRTVTVQQLIVSEAPPESPLGKILRRVRQRLGNDACTLEIIPAHMLGLEQPGTISRTSISLSLAKLLVLAVDPGATATVMASIASLRSMHGDSANAYTGSFVHVSGAIPTLIGANISSIAGLLVGWEYQTRRMVRLTDDDQRRTHVISVAEMIFRAETGIRNSLRLVANAESDLTRVDRLLVQGATASVVRREEAGSTALFFQLQPPTGAAYIVGVLHNDRTPFNGEGAYPSFALFGPEVSESSGLGYEAPIRQRQVREAATRLLANAAVTPREAHDFLTLVSAHHRRRLELSKQMMEFNYRQLSDAITMVQRHVYQREAGAYERLLDILAGIEAYPLNRATLMDLRSETPPVPDEETAAPPGIPMPVNTLLKAQLTEALATSAPRTVLVEQISVDIATRLAQSAGWLVRSRGAEESFDLELLPHGRSVVHARLEVKGVFLSGRSQPEFELPESEIAVARDASVPWYLVVVAFDDQGNSQVYVFDKRDWRPGDAGETARTIRLEPFIRAVPTVAMPRP